MKTPESPKGNPSALAKGAQKSIGRLSPRQRRALLALRSGPVMREALDRIAGASNSPHIIMELRRMGLVIECERLHFLDRDGRACRPGRYTLAVNSQLAATAMLENFDGERA